MGSPHADTADLLAQSVPVGARFNEAPQNCRDGFRLSQPAESLTFVASIDCHLANTGEYFC
jgi:hypothetical protein